MDLSVVTVNYRSLDPLLECLASLPGAAPGLAVDVTVVDNEQGSGVRAALSGRFPGARVIENAENVGYARAVNQGIAATAGTFVLVLNPDCVLRPGSLRTLVDYLSAHPMAAVAGPKILGPDGVLEFSARSFPDHTTLFFNRYSLLTRLFPGNRFSRHYLLSDWDHASVRSVDWLSGACLMVRRSAIEKVGPMDEAFFMFNEDVDWCRRMKLAGYDVVYVPDAVIVHRIGASRSRVAAKVIYERHRGMVHYFHKHHPTNPVLALAADALIFARAGLMLVINTLRTR